MKGERYMNYQAELEKMRANYAKNPLKDINLHRPWWILYDDEMARIYEEKKKLVQYGQIYYAHLVQANNHLFRAFPPFDYPAQLLYSTDPAIECDPLLLQEVSLALYSYKNSDEKPPEEWKEMVRVIEDERDRTVFSFDCPMKSGTFWATMQPMMVFRRHLPGRVLKGGLLPILACPAKCQSILILPKEYWTENFTNAWGVSI